MRSQLLTPAAPLPIVSAVVLCLALTGCGQGRPDVLRVTGTVTYKDQPVPNLFLNFKPVQGRPSWGYTDASGVYELEYARGKKGALAGKHKVWFIVDKPPPPPGTMKATTDTPAAELSATDRKALKEKHGTEEKSLEFEVSEDGQVIDIAIN